jgi:hypothetical protein
MGSIDNTTTEEARRTEDHKRRNRSEMVITRHPHTVCGPLKSRYFCFNTRAVHRSSDRTHDEVRARSWSARWLPCHGQLLWDYWKRSTFSNRSWSANSFTRRGPGDRDSQCTSPSISVSAVIKYEANYAYVSINSPLDSVLEISLLFQWARGSNRVLIPSFPMNNRLDKHFWFRYAQIIFWDSITYFYINPLWIWIKIGINWIGCIFINFIFINCYSTKCCISLFIMFFKLSIIFINSLWIESRCHFPADHPRRRPDELRYFTPTVNHPPSFLPDLKIAIHLQSRHQRRGRRAGSKLHAVIDANRSRPNIDDPPHTCQIDLADGRHARTA